MKMLIIYSAETRVRGKETSPNMSYQYIYIIQLENQKFYVGQDQDPETALFNHKYKHISDFTHKYKPIGEGGFLMAPFIGDNNDINEITKNLMHQYGFDNVRNCTKYSQLILEAEQIMDIKKELGESSSTPGVACERCGRMYHCRGRCTVYRDILGKVIPSMPDIYRVVLD